MESPDIHKLRLIDWQFFDTLTFKSERLPERVRLSAYFVMMRKVAKQFRVFFPHLPCCLRLESGEATGRVHFHAGSDCLRRIILGGGVMEQPHILPLIRGKFAKVMNGYLRVP